MGFITDTLKEKRGRQQLLDAWYGGDDIYAEGPTASGALVSEQSAMRISAVYACVKIVAWTLASLPLPTYRRMQPRGKERAYEHSNYLLLHDRPNPEQTSFEWRALMSAYQNLWGLGLSEIEYDRRTGAPAALWPIPPWRVEVMRSSGAAQRFFRVTLPDGGKQNLAPQQVLEFRALSTHPDHVMSPVAVHRETIGLSAAMKKFGARTFGQGTNPAGIVTTDQQLKEETINSLRDYLAENYAGLSRSHRLMMLHGGLKFDRVGLPPEDAQYLESQKFGIAEIARIYNVPLHLLQEHQSSTTWGSGLEELNQGFVTFTLRPYLVQWEQELKRKLFYNPADQDYFAEFLVDGLLRGNQKDRTEAYQKRFMMASLSPNDIRELENENPYEGGDEYYVPVNMVPVSLALSEAEQKEIEGTEPAARGEKLKEIRARRSASSRFNIAASYKQVIGDAAGRVIRREEADVMRKARRVFGERSAEQAQYFTDWLSEFYEKHLEYLQKQMAPPFSALAQAIDQAASEEIGLEYEGRALSREHRQHKAQVDDFVNEYLAAYSVRHAGSSRGQLRQVVNQAVEAGEDPVEALQTRFDEWGEKRPAQIADRENTQLSNAVAMTVFAIGGVLRKRWVALGTNTCPLCEELDGRVVGIKQPFLAANDRLEAENAQPIELYRPTLHPQLHKGCVCQIVAD